VLKDDAEDDSSAASPSHAEAASKRGPDPGPPNIKAELISGGKNTNAGINRNPNRPSQRLLPRTARRPPAAISYLHTPQKGILRHPRGKGPNLLQTYFAKPGVSDEASPPGPDDQMCRTENPQDGTRGGRLTALEAHRQILGDAIHRNPFLGHVVTSAHGHGVVLE